MKLECRKIKDRSALLLLGTQDNVPSIIIKGSGKALVCVPTRMDCEKKCSKVLVEAGHH